MRAQNTYLNVSEFLESKTLPFQVFLNFWHTIDSWLQFDEIFIEIHEVANQIQGQRVSGVKNKNLFPNLNLWHTVSPWRDFHSFLSWKLSHSVAESFSDFLFGFNGTRLHLLYIFCFKNYNFFFRIKFLTFLVLWLTGDANLVSITSDCCQGTPANDFLKCFVFLAWLWFWLWVQSEIKTIKRIIS